MYDVEPKNYKCPPMKVYMYGKQIACVEDFLYLGIFISSNDNEEIKNQYRKISIRSNTLLRKFGKCSENIKIQLFKTYCQSIYGLGLWCDYTCIIFNRMRVCYNNAFRFLIGLERFCSASEMFVSRHLKSFQELVRQKQYILFNSISESENILLQATSTMTFKNTKLWCKWHNSLFV